MRACFLCVCVHVFVCVGHMFLHRMHMATRGSIRPNIYDPLISSRRPTSTPAVSTATDRGTFRGCGDCGGDATLLNEPQKVSAWMVPVMNQRLQSFLFNSNFDKHALSRLTSLTGTRCAELRLPRNKTKEEKKSKPPLRQGMRRCFLLCFLSFKLNFSCEDVAKQKRCTSTKAAAVNSTTVEN